jgi:hypothetical protein
MAATATASAETIVNPGKLDVAASTRTIFIALTAIGIAVFIAGLASDPTRAWASFVQNHFFFMSLGIGGLFWAAIQWLTGAMWSAPVRRISESFSAYLPVALVTTVILGFGIHHLYIWSDMKHVSGDVVLEGKSGYLNAKFMMIRDIGGVLLWMFFAKKFIGNSLAQDSSGDYAYTARNRSLSPAFMIVFGLSFTLMAFDQLMSLDPHWYSTMFGVYCFAGMFYSTLALHGVMTVALLRRHKLDGIVNDNHLHDLGKFMFAFTVFWAYIAFSQFMLIWYANLPEETGYFIHRFNGNWMGVSIYLLVGKFVVPFFLLLPRGMKRTPGVLWFAGVWMLFSQWIDVLWMVQPEFFKDGPSIGWIELGVPLGFIGLFGLSVSYFLSKNNIVAIGDPRLKESVFHHHQ